MLTKRLLVMITLLVASVVVAIAQPSNDQVTSITTRNNKVSDEISKGTGGKYFVHRLTLNSNSKVWAGIGNYTEMINCYFELEGGRAILNKIIVTTNIAGRTAYADYLYDGSGNPAMCFFHYDITKPSGKKLTTYYMNKTPIGVTTDEWGTILASEFGNPQAEISTEMLVKAINYKTMFDALASVQYNGK